MEVEFQNLDDDWIHSFENADKLYKDFYKEDLYYVNLRVIYVNRNNEIEKLKQESLLLQKPNHILREQILEILKKHSIDNNKRYTLISILRYNLTLEPDEINHYLTNGENNDYLSVIKHIDAIEFDKSINMFHDLNDIIFLFYEKSTEIVKRDPNNSTRKIYLRDPHHTNNKKTLKKRYKE